MQAKVKIHQRELQSPTLLERSSLSKSFCATAEKLPGSPERQPGSSPLLRGNATAASSELTTPHHFNMLPLTSIRLYDCHPDLSFLEELEQSGQSLATVMDPNTTSTQSNSISYCYCLNADSQKGKRRPPYIYHSQHQFYSYY